MNLDMDATLGFVLSAARFAAPLLCACLGGLWSERAGVVDIGLEGKMLMGAFAGATVATFTGQASLGLLAALLASLMLAVLHGHASIDRRGNQIVSGLAVNMIAAGATALIGNALFGEGGRTPELAGAQRFAALAGGLDLLAIASFLAAPLTAFLLLQTRFGLRLRAAGENPHALAAAGVRVRPIRYAAVAICGLLCGLAGAQLSLAQAAGFLPNMTAGKGFVALAALVFAGWRPGRAVAACVLFGALDALAIRAQGSDLYLLSSIPIQLLQAMPYIFTLILLAGFVGRSVPPAASGVPYAERR